MIKVLVVEDETAIRENVIETLEMSGYIAIDAENGHVGIEMAYEQLPDLILCDIMMPELSGYDVLLTLREDPRTINTPFIFMTAKADRTFVRHGMELGADDYLTKPFTPPELLATVKARLDRHAAMEEASAESLKQARQGLVKMITHELRTPLIAINTSVEIMSRQVGQLTPHQTQELLGDIGSGSKRLNRLVEQIVLATRLETEALCRETIAEQGLPTQPWELLTAAVNLARRFAYRHPDVTIQLDERDLNVMVICDRGALRQTLAEIISNALSFSPASSEIVVSQWLAGAYLWISVVDQGVGIPAEELDRVSEGFYQYDRTTHDQQGVGLGLTLARRVIEAHGGILELSSVVGKGTQVNIGLPVVEM